MQFRWFALLLVLAVIAASLVAFGTLGVFVSALMLILACLLNRAKTVLRAILYFAAILLGIGLLSLPAISCVREAARRMQCTSNIKQIVIALHNYHQTFECFPPAYVADKNGKPMHSWRVLILPFMDEQRLYDKYNFDEPWDGVNNRKLLDERLRVYGCPSDKNARGGRTTYTNYLAVVGPNAAWQGEKPRNLDVDLRGKDDSTILLVESINADIPWTEPKDMALDASHVVNPANSQVVVSSRHEREVDYFHHDAPMAYTAMGNGSVRSIPVGIRAGSPLLCIGGCTDEALSGLWNLQFNWAHCIGLPVWLVSVGLLLYQAVRSRKRRAAG